MAAAVEVEEKLKDDCPICLETYKEPKILPCIHTFCTHCLRATGEKLKKNPGDTMPCPVCRKEFAIPETGFGGLQRNFFMDKLTEIKNILQPSSARSLCDACREEDESIAEAVNIPSAEMYCVQCRQMLCCECYKHHRKNKITKSHRIIAVEEFRSGDLQETLTTDSCEKHPNCLLEIYCSCCQKVVCAICFVENHRGHVGSDVNKVATDFREEIQMNVDEFSSFLTRLRREQQESGNYRTELVHCIEEMQLKVNERRQELKELVDKHADSLLLELDSMRQQNLKKCDLDKEDIETLFICLESYNSYCLQLTTVGSASDICRAKTALDARTEELKQLHISLDNRSHQLPRVSLKMTELQDGLRSADQNIIGELEELQGQDSGRTKDGNVERSTDPKFDNLHDSNLHMEKSITSTFQGDMNRTTAMEEDEEDSKEFIECNELNLDGCVVADSIELECLRDLETILKRKLKLVATDESSLHDKLKEVKQRVMSMLETINTLNVILESERVHLREVEKERDTLVDRNKECESNEVKVSKMAEDFKSQVALLRGLVYGSGDQAKKTKGRIICDRGLGRTTTLERVSNSSCDFEIFGIAILDNELYVVSNENVAVIYDLPTLRFQRRWRVPRNGIYDDIKQCNVNKCLYMMKVELQEQKHNEIIRVDANGNEIAAWSVAKSRGQLSVTADSNILLTVSSTNELHEYAPDGKLIELICIPWNSGIENPSYAIKLTSDHFLICHGKDKDALARVCMMEKTGNVLKYFRELFNGERLGYPIYLDIDEDGNVLLADNVKGWVLLVGSDLIFKRFLLGNGSSSFPKKVCFDKYGRVLVVWQNEHDDVVLAYNIA